MTVIVGVGPHTSDSVVLLANRLAAAGQQIVLCGVVLDTWEGPSLATGLDPQWRRGLIDSMEETLHQRREAFTDPENVTTTVRVGSSVPAELLAEAEERRADVLVIASSRRAAFGRVSLGSISDQLVHSAGLPIAVTPNDYVATSADTIQRLVLGVQPSDAQIAAEETIAFARAINVPVELVTFSVSPWRETMHVNEVHFEGVFNDWNSQIAQCHDDAEATLGGAGVDVSGKKRVDAHRWSQALAEFDWRDGDMLAVCSSRRGPVARVFLGSTAARMLRHSPVPAVVLPRGPH